MYMGVYFVHRTHMQLLTRIADLKIVEVLKRHMESPPPGHMEATMLL